MFPEENRYAGYHRSNRYQLSFGLDRQTQSEGVIEKHCFMGESTQNEYSERFEYRDEAQTAGVVAGHRAAMSQKNMKRVCTILLGCHDHLQTRPIELSPLEWRFATK